MKQLVDNTEESFTSRANKTSGADNETKLAPSAKQIGRFMPDWTGKGRTIHVDRV